MLKKKKIQFFLSTVITLSISLYPASILGKTSCERAEELFQKASRQANTTDEEAILEEIVSLCPEHAKAWNNLGTIYENEGKLEQAEKAYRLANEHRPDLGVPLAGLGDVAMSLGRYQEAIKRYEAFLTFLANEKQKGDPQDLGIYEEEYQARYKKANLKLQILNDSMSAVVPKERISRGLQIIPPKDEFNKGIKTERLSLFIYFDFDSAELKPQGRAQLIEMAQVMLLQEYRERIFLIEGHADTLGSEAYNLGLSRERAENVRTFLASQSVMSSRLRVKGVGESKPLVQTGSKDEQSINRRVEFVLLGFYGK